MLDNFAFVIAVGIFVISLILFIVDWVDKTMVALLGAVGLIAFGVLDWEEAITSIDFETLALLLGLMLAVAVAQHSGIFSWMNVKIAQVSRGNPLAIFLLFFGLTCVASFILNNATVVLLVIPVAIALSEGLGLSTKLLVILISMASNIGGALTLIGDPPNTLIGIQAHLSFMSFVQNLWLPVLGLSIATVAYIIAVYWKTLQPIRKHLSKLMVSNLIIKRITYKFAGESLNRYVVITTVIGLLLTVVSLVFQPQLGIPIGALGLLSGFGIALLVFRHSNFVHLIKEVEWDSLVFFGALFIQVGALQKVGFLNMITEFISSFADNYVVLLLVIIWGIGLASMVINNIPFVALMIPVIFDLQTKLAGQPHLDLLWWALALGACLGGNGTIIGSSSGILAVDLAKKRGIPISFLEFAKVGVPVTLISLTVSSMYIVARVYL